MKNKKDNFIIKLGLYPFDVMVSLGQSDEELKKSLKDNGAEWDDNMECKQEASFFIDSSNRSLLRTNKYPETCRDFGTLQHEIFHVVTFILDRMGMKLMLEVSDEAYAYLIGFLTEEIYKKIK